MSFYDTKLKVYLKLMRTLHTKKASLYNNSLDCKLMTQGAVSICSNVTNAKCEISALHDCKFYFLFPTIEHVSYELIQQCV